MTDKLLTHKKRKWVNSRKPEILRGPAINPNAAVEGRYRAALEALIRQMVDETEKTLRDLFEEPHVEEYFAQDAKSTASQARIAMNAIMKKFNGLFDVKAKPLAERFTKQSDKASSAAVHSTLKDLSGGLSLPVAKLDAAARQILKATVAENVGLIKTIPQKYLGQVQGAVMRSITSGQGLKTLMPQVEKYKGITYKRARFISMDQTRKAMNNLSRGRLEKAGLKTFEWLHTGGSSEPRKLHIDLSGKVFAFDKPPVIDKKTGERGFPGQLPGCRCRMKAVLTFDD